MQRTMWQCILDQLACTSCKKCGCLPSPDYIVIYMPAQTSINVKLVRAKTAALNA